MMLCLQMSQSKIGVAFTCFLPIARTNYGVVSMFKYWSLHGNTRLHLSFMNYSPLCCIVKLCNEYNGFSALPCGTLTSKTIVISMRSRRVLAIVIVRDFWFNCMLVLDAHALIFSSATPKLWCSRIWTESFKDEITCMCSPSHLAPFLKSYIIIYCHKC